MPKFVVINLNLSVPDASRETHIMAFGQNLAISAPVALFLAIVTWPSEDSASERPVAQDLAKVFNGILPKSMPDGSYIYAPEAEGDTLVFTVSPSSDALQSLTLAEFERLNINAMCVSGGDLKGYFGKGGKIRFDVKKADGSIRKGDTRANCP
jgi:hypothetical protein